MPIGSQNPYFISPAMVGQNMTEGVMQGMKMRQMYDDRQASQEDRQASQEAAQRTEDGRAAMSTAISDAEKAQVMRDYPEFADEIRAQIDTANDVTSRRNISDYTALYRVKTLEDAEKVLQKRIIDLREQGDGTKTAESEEDLRMLQSGEMDLAAIQGMAGLELERTTEGASHRAKLDEERGQPSAQTELGKLYNLRDRMEASGGRHTKARLEEIDRKIASVTGAGGIIDPDFLKEERKSASDTVRGSKKRALEISGSIGKIESLTPQMKSGNRQAVAAGIMSLARIVSPGIVTEGDFRQLSGAQDPIATALGIISGKDQNVANELQKYYDPANPDTFDADALMAVARSLVGAESPAIIAQLDEAESRATRSGMNDRQRDTIFGDVGSIRGLSRYIDSGDDKSGADLPEVNEDGTQVMPSTNAKGWILKTDKNGVRAYVNKNNPQEYEEI